MILCSIMAQTGNGQVVLKPFITVFRPGSSSIGSDTNRLNEFDKLFEKWKRRQAYRRKIERSGAAGHASPSAAGKKPKDSLSRLQPFGFQSPPKILEIKPLKLHAKRTNHAGSGGSSTQNHIQFLPSIVNKQTVASLARR